ncbi:uncharacterized protein LOC111128447 isoform X2 [Crassostrea virginica]|uniref:Uncharacterized protein LOC111128447 isoform X2 n=1 Tax=Crassostrea virginica TaxID=6565 RepID=A0A8B8E3C4_CRAVI|nr:uncharacterized protein LOC111128447 isoform X2 [Crassostrea virginica]XP_022335057.1 uncharacterized protein LOC111131702 isoform X3 [Crassostrea virginica]
MPSLKLVIAFLISMGLPAFVFSGECCKAHYDILFKFNKEKWCSNYCCLQVGKYDCCDTAFLQAPSSEREDFCSAYFDANVWAAVLLAIGIIAVVVGGCVCICKVCCPGHRSTGVVIPGQTGPGVTVVNSQNSQMTQQHPGYPMYPPPGGNPA